MDKHDRLPNGKPYDIRERLFEFACDVTRAAQDLQRHGRLGDAFSAQLASAGVSATANAEEADDGSSKRDFRAKERITLREIKEVRVRLRVARATGLLDEKYDALIQEATELTRILATIIRNSENRSENSEP